MTKNPIPYLLGVDGGGSGTRARVCTLDGIALGRGESGPGNIATDTTRAIVHIREAVTLSLQDAGLPHTPDEQGVAVYALAGSNIGDFKDTFARSVPFRRYEIVNDGFATLRGAFHTDDGCLLAIGTGIIMYRQYDDAVASFGGWGYDVSDYGSGAWMGNQLLRRSLLCADGMGHHSALTRAVLAEFRDSPAAIATFAAHATPADYARYMPRLLEAHAADDAIAQAIIHDAITHIEQSIDCLSWGTTTPLPICMAGGLGKIMASYLQEPYQARLVEAKGNALDGCIVLAREMGARLTSGQ